MKSAPEQTAQKAERLREAKGSKQMQKAEEAEANGTSSHEQKMNRLRRLVGEGRKVSRAVGVELRGKKNTPILSVILPSLSWQPQSMRRVNGGTSSMGA